MDRLTKTVNGQGRLIKWTFPDQAKAINEAIYRLADIEDKLERGEMVERPSGCCWCIADDIQNKTYIRTDDTEYSWIDAAFCPKCGRKLEAT